MGFIKLTWAQPTHSYQSFVCMNILAVALFPWVDETKTLRSTLNDDDNRRKNLYLPSWLVFTSILETHHVHQRYTCRPKWRKAKLHKIFTKPPYLTTLEMVNWTALQANIFFDSNKRVSHKQCTKAHVRDEKFVIE